MSKKLTKEIMPLYGRVAAIIQSQISSGQLNPGDKLPIEDELASYYGVSKITIRGALSRLESDGLITRIRGKGTFVSENVPEVSRTISSNLQKTVLAISNSTLKKVERGIIKVKESRTPRVNREFFNLDNNDDILRVQRVISSGKALYYYDNYLPKEYSKHLTKTELRKKKSIQRVLRDNINLKVTKGDMYLQALPSDPDISEHLECQSFEPLIHIQSFFWHDDHIPFEITNFYLRSSYFKYKIKMKTEP